MARVPLSDLIELVKGSPHYYRKWSGDAPAEAVFGIAFTSLEESAIRTETFDIKDGRTLVLDFDRDHRVLGIEIA